MVRLTTWFPMQPRPTPTRWYIPLISTVSPPVVVGVGVNKADNGGRGRGHLPRNYSSSNVLNVTSTFFFFRYLLLHTLADTARCKTYETYHSEPRYKRKRMDDGISSGFRGRGWAGCFGFGLV
jgi:hypothetical protein